MSASNSDNEGPKPSSPVTQNNDKVVRDRAETGEPPETAPATKLDTVEVASEAAASFDAAMGDTSENNANSLPCASSESRTTSSNGPIPVSNDDSTWDGRAEDDGHGEETIDPRVEGALQSMNDASDAINKHEKDLENTKRAFHEAMDNVQLELKQLGAKLGKRNIDKARGYHLALFDARKAHYESRQAAMYYEKASSAYQRAKHKVTATEKQLEKGAAFDQGLQIKLNQATEALMVAFKRKEHADTVHQSKTESFLKADAQLMALAKQRKRVVVKTKPYFDTKAKYDQILMGLRQQLLEQEQATKAAKASYAAALQQLSDISEEVHRRRQEEVQPATSGQRDVGEESVSLDGQPASTQRKASSDYLQQRVAEARAEAVRQEEREAARAKDAQDLLDAEAGLEAAVMDHLSEDRAADLRSPSADVAATATAVDDDDDDTQSEHSSLAAGSLGDLTALPLYETSVAMEQELATALVAEAVAAGVHDAVTSDA